MPEYSEQDLKYAAEFREGVHAEALEIIRKTRPYLTKVVDVHPVEDYFQQVWDYPGKWYTMVAVPEGYTRKSLIKSIVEATLAADKCADEDFFSVLSDYPDCAVEYCILSAGSVYLGYESHREALKKAWTTQFSSGGEWWGNPNLATGKSISVEEFLSSDYEEGKLNYRKAFLYPPYQNNCTGRDFVRVNAALFPNGTDHLEVVSWTTDWSEYFDDGHEWWGALCLTVYDKSLSRFVVIMASATD